MLIIRKMTKADRAAVLEMMRIFYRSPAVMTDGSEEIFERDFSECVSESPFAEGFIFEFSEKIAGYSMLALSFSTEFGRPCVWVEDLYILPEFRRKGVGTAFFRFLDKTFPNRIIRLEAEKDNLPAVALYKKSGFGEIKYFEMIKK